MRVILTPAEIETVAKAHGLSMISVCKEAGVSYSTFTRWKTGATEPTLNVYRRIFDAAHRIEEGGGNTIPSPAAIEAARTTAETLARWGMSWPPPRGWRRTLERRRAEAMRQAASASA
jgi:transcriptional regulator with XRE-family HTH domain